LLVSVAWRTATLSLDTVLKRHAPVSGRWHDGGCRRKRRHATAVTSLRLWQHCAARNYQWRKRAALPLRSLNRSFHGAPQHHALRVLLRAAWRVSPSICWCRDRWCDSRAGGLFAPRSDTAATLPLARAQRRWRHIGYVGVERARIACYVAWHCTYMTLPHSTIICALAANRH